MQSHHSRQVENLPLISLRSQILFLTLMTGAAAMFLTAAIPRLPTSLVVPIPLFLGAPYLFTYLATVHRGHQITPSTHAQHMRDYPYDHILFQPGNICKTCNQLKPARSKHCSLCGTCIAMCDHHCPWINNCVGRGNYRYFLFLLLSLGMMELYGAYLAYYILRPWLTFNTVLPLLSRGRWQDNLNTALHAIHKGGLAVAGVGLLATSTFLLPLGLLAYHCYLIWAGMTTNESQKWTDRQYDLADGLVFKAKYSALQRHNRLRKYDGSNDSSNPTASFNPALNTSKSEEEPDVPWPVSSDQIIVATTDGEPPTGQEALWHRIWSLSEVDNIYDLGGWDNFMEILKGR